MDPSTSHEVAAHFPSLTAQLPRLVEPSWRHAAAWHVLVSSVFISATALRTSPH